MGLLNNENGFYYKHYIKDFWFWFFFSETPCGGLPVLNVNGTEVAQSVAVARYLAREFKLDGKNNVEKAQGDMIVDCITDAFFGIP